MAWGGKIAVLAVLGVGLLALMAFATILAFVPQGGQAGTREFSYRTTPTSGSNFTLSVDNVNGGIELVQWASDVVLINGTITASGFGANPSDVQLVPFATGSEMSLKLILPAESFFFGRQYNIPVKVFVPHSLVLGSLQLRTVNGALDVPSGTISHSTSLSTVNGEISFAGISGGGFTANAVNGPITGRFDELSQGGNYAVSTTNGDVQVTIPRGESYVLSMQNLNGEISTSGLGSVTVSQSSNHRLTANVGGQGSTAQVSLETINGDLSLAGE